MESRSVATRAFMLLFAVAMTAALVVSVPVCAHAGQAGSGNLVPSGQDCDDRKDAWDFFAWLPDGIGRDAIAVLDSSPVAQATHRGDVNDATTIQNMRESVKWMKRCNEIRQSRGLEPLKVNFTLLAIAMSDCNWSLDNIKHAHVFNVGENLSWGNSDPFVKWYDNEKKSHEAQDGKETGHYLNIIRSDYEYTGFAIATGGRYKVVYGQTFGADWYGAGEILRDHAREDGSSIVLTSDTERGTVSVEEYERALDDFVSGRQPGIVPAAAKTKMQRLYNPNSGEHFYTASAAERDHLVSVGWRYEGVGWTAPSTSATPVHRLYNANAGDHHYTASAAERDHLVSVGWKYEGVGWYSDDARGVPLYRQYNPNAVAGSHNYTADVAENDMLVSVGWRAEGIGWYGTR